MPKTPRLTLCTALISSAVFFYNAKSFGQSEQDLKSAPFLTSYQPCSTWIYDINLHSYVCQFLGSYSEGVERYEMDQLKSQVNFMEQRIQALETRLATLESRP